MAIKISALPAATSANFTDQLPMSVGTSTTYKEYPAQLQTLFLSSTGSTLLTGVRLAETSARTVIYANGAAGVGATLTNNTTLAALTIDGVAAVAGDRVLITAQVSSFQNGIYTVTNIGSASVAWILTRATDWDVSAEMIQFQMATVSAGGTHANQVWQYVTSGSITVGTTGILWQTFATDAVTARKIQNNQYIRSADAGVANAYVANILPTVSSYTDGLRVDILVANTNNTASTLKVGAGAITAIKLGNGGALVGGEMPAGMVAQFEYDGTNFQLLNPFYAGFTLPLSLANGGTGKALVAANGGIVYSDADSFEILAPTATAGQMLRSGSSAAPAWSTATFPATATGTGTILRADGTNWVASTATYPDTTTVSQILYSSSTNVVGGITTANSAALVTNSTGVPAMSGTMTNGQLIIGSTGATPTAAAITAGSGISVTNGAASITIASTASGLTWNNVAGTSQAAAVNNGYVIGNASQTTVTLPAVAPLGSTIAIQGKGAAGWVMTANTGQTIHLGASVTSTAGSLASVNLYDSVEVVCITANTVWSVTRVLSAGLTIT